MTSKGISRAAERVANYVNGPETRKNNNFWKADYNRIRRIIKEEQVEPCSLVKELQKSNECLQEISGFIQKNCPISLGPGRINDIAKWRALLIELNQDFI